MPRELPLFPELEPEPTADPEEPPGRAVAEGRDGPEREGSGDPGSEAVPSEPEGLDPELPLEPDPGTPGREDPVELATFADRVKAGSLDLALHLGIAVILLASVLLMRAPLDWRLLPALLLFSLVFSFVYVVVPLAFWGRTPGMARVGLVARDRDGGALTFAQTGWRWLSGVLVVVTLGGALALSRGREGLADRLSGSRTLRQE